MWVQTSILRWWNTYHNQTTDSDLSPFSLCHISSSDHNYITNRNCRWTLMVHNWSSNFSLFFKLPNLFVLTHLNALIPGGSVWSGDPPDSSAGVRQGQHQDGQEQTGWHPQPPTLSAEPWATVHWQRPMWVLQTCICPSLSSFEGLLVLLLSLAVIFPFIRLHVHLFPFRICCFLV